MTYVNFDGLCVVSRTTVASYATATPAWSAPFLLNNLTLDATLSCDYATVAYSAGRFMTAINSDIGVTMRSSTNGGVTWSDVMLTQQEGRVNINGRKVAIAATAGGSFAIAYASSNASFPIVIERFNGIALFEPFGLSEFGISAGFAYNNNDYLGSGYTLPAFASDGTGFMVAFMVFSVDGNSAYIEFQTNANNAQAKFATVNNVTLADVQRRNSGFRLMSNGVRGFYMFLSSSFDSGNLFSEITTDNGRTWSTPRTIRLANTGNGGAGAWISATYTNEFLAAWTDSATNTDGVYAQNIAFSSSPDGYYWSAPELLEDADLEAVGYPILVATSSSSYILSVVSTNQTTSVLTIKCEQNYRYNSGEVAQLATLVAAVAAFAVVVLA